jgi:hypothetical protein
VHLVKTRIVIIIKKANYAAGNGNSHAKNIDKQVQLVLHHASKGDEQKIFNHTMNNLSNDNPKTRLPLSRLRV